MGIEAALLSFMDVPVAGSHSADRASVFNRQFFDLMKFLIT
jgi:hypothetical protein